MKQIATVIPGILNRITEDERLAGFKWHENKLGSTSLVDAKGNPYPIRAVTCYTDHIAGRMLMFHLTVLNSVLGLNATEKDCTPTLVGIISLEEDVDHIARIEQLIDALQNCYIYDSEKERDDDATNMMSCFSNMKLATPTGAMGELAGQLGLKISDPFHIGYTGEITPMAPQLMNAIRWRTLQLSKLPPMDGPDHKAFGVYYAEVHKCSLELGVSHTLDWDEKTKDWTLLIAGSDNVPRHVFQYGDLGQVFFEAMTYLYDQVEQKYAK